MVDGCLVITRTMFVILGLTVFFFGAALHEFYKAPPDEFTDKVAALRSRGEQNWPDISQRRIERCIRKFQSAKYDGSPYRPVLHSPSEDDMAPINLNDGPSIVGEKKKAGAKADAGGSSRRGGKEADASQKKEKRVPVVGKEKAATVAAKAPPKKLTKQQKAKGVAAAVSQKRPVGEAATSVSPPPAKKAKATQALTFEYAGEKDVIWQDRSACAELLRAASGSSAPRPEDTGEEDRYLFIAQMLLKAGCALTLLYDGMSGKVAEAASGGGEEVGELQAAVEKAKEAYAVEQARSASLEIELGQTKVELEKYVIGVSKEQAENGRLRAKLESVEKRLADESDRLRRSRADCVSRERGLRNGLVEKVRTYLRGKKEADDVKSLYYQAKGTREALEDVKLTSQTLVLDDAIAQYGKMEEQYKAEAGLSSFDELVEGDLVAYEDRPGINEYGSNDGLTTEEGTLRIPEVTSQTPPAGEEQPAVQDD